LVVTPLINMAAALACLQWFSPGTPVSSTNKTDRHDITEILLEVALKTMPYPTLFLTI